MTFGDWAHPPHVRGDEPGRSAGLDPRRHNPPHVRGDEPAQLASAMDDAGIRPTCVGMNREDKRGQERTKNPPHVRGDEPEEIPQERRGRQDPPHVRGDEPEREEAVAADKDIRPTCVGMNRGGERNGICYRASAPRAWG